jgi:erythromycin esterase
VEWLKQNAIPIASIDPSLNDFSDLLPLKDLIGTARVVQLGEQSHGDGECFLAKVRLVKFLHQEMGFDVLAFESGLFDCHTAWKDFQAGASPLSAAQKGVFSIWTGSQQTESLWNYLSEKASSETPLELIGFDCQFTASASRETLVDSLLALIKKQNLELDKSIVDEFTVNMQRAIEGNTANCQWEPILNVLQKLREELAKSDGSLRDAERTYWMQLLKSTIEYCNQLRRPSENDIAMQVNGRDAQMADNLLWYVRTFPNRKVMVWAASFHITRYLEEFHPRETSLQYKGTIPMGQFVHESLGRDCFTIGFTSYEGKAGTWFRQPWSLQKAPTGTFESTCQEAGLINAIVPLRDLPDDSWLHQKVLSRPLGYSWMEARWPRHFDAMIFQKTMTPSTSR